MHRLRIFDRLVSTVPCNVGIHAVSIHTMTTRTVWDGRGEIPEGAAYFTKNDGTLCGRSYVRRRAVQRLSGRWQSWPKEDRARTIRETVENDDWMIARNLYLVAAIVRDVESHLFGL